MKPAKRVCCAVLGKPELHKGEDIYICGLSECKTPFPPYLPLCGAHRALAEAKGSKGVLVYVEEGLGRFSL